MPPMPASAAACWRCRRRLAPRSPATRCTPGEFRPAVLQGRRPGETLGLEGRLLHPMLRRPDGTLARGRLADRARPASPKVSAGIVARDWAQNPSRATLLSSGQLSRQIDRRCSLGPIRGATIRPKPSATRSSASASRPARACRRVAAASGGADGLRAPGSRRGGALGAQPAEIAGAAGRRKIAAQPPSASQHRRSRRPQ